MIVPPPRPTIFGAIAAVNRNGALTLTANVSSKVASGKVVSWPAGEDAGVVDEDVDVGGALGECTDVVGRLEVGAHKLCLAAVRLDRRDHFGAAPSLRPLIKTCAPSRASACAVARPMPEVPPVTNARFGLNSCIRVLLSRC
jgi:hypothetical protein